MQRPPAACRLLALVVLRISLDPYDDGAELPPLPGGYMARVFVRQRTWLDPLVRPCERLIYRLTGVDETHEMRWTEYAVALHL